jgi:cell division septal protein FtsQ
MKGIHFRKRKKIKRKRSVKSAYRRLNFKAIYRKVSLFFKRLFGGFVRNRVIRIVATILAIVILILIGGYLLFSPNFDIKNIEVSGNEIVKKEDLDSRLSFLYDRNIFLIRASQVRNEVIGMSPYVKSVRVEKHLPDNVTIFLEEREPTFTWVNLSGSYLVDLEGVVLEVLADFENLEFSQEEIDLLKGYGNLKELEEDENEETDKLEDGENTSSDTQEDVLNSESDEEDNSEELNKIVEERRREIISKVDQFWITNVEDLGEGEKLYPYVFSYEQRDYSVLESLDSSIIDATTKGLEINYLSEEVLRFIWEGDYRFVIYLKHGRKIVFSTRRDFADQINDLEILLVQLRSEGKSFSYIDLSSEVIVYEVDE